MKKVRVIAPLVVLLLALGALTSVQAQNIVISLRVPQFFDNVLTDELLAQFEAENPGVSVHVVASGFGVGDSYSDIDTYLEDMLDYASSADVVFADGSIQPEATRAGLFLDLAPLTSSDPSLNVNDFLPAAWQSFQWDNGVWGLPVSVNVTSMTYNTQAFDNAGMPYPSAAWTLDDLANAARALSETDTSGNITSPGLVVLGNSAFTALIRSLLGTGFYDASSLPESPYLSNPALESLLTAWAELENEGVVSRSFSGNFLELPMRIGGGVFQAVGAQAGSAGQSQNTSVNAPLPGGATLLDTQGFAISSGTQYPEQAYALAKFLTTRPEVANSFFGVRPARDSLVGVQPELDGPGGGAIAVFRSFSPEMEAFLNSVLPSALPSSELRYGSYLNGVMSDILQNGLDAATALQDAEIMVNSNLQTSADQRDTALVLVATPPPPVVLGEGEISINFGMTSFIQPLPNQEQWDRVIQEFVASDPQVGQVNMEVPGMRGLGGADQMAAEYDCFYLPYNNVPELDTSAVLNLDPYLDADPSFNRSDVVGTTLSQVQRDAMIWAMPLTIQPQILNYSPERFAAAGAFAPQNGWSVDEFVNALNALKVVTEDDAPFEARTPGSTHLLMLIAAFGGLPLDYRTDPATINFTDPATVDAVRQVLDLAKQGLIDYQEQAQGGMIALFINQADADASLTPITAQSFSGFGFVQLNQQGENPYRMTTYPTGTQYTPMGYDITTGYISATSENSDACYRWLSTIARHPELFDGMPARRSLLDDPSVAAALGADAVAFYRQYENTIQSPNAVTFPTAFAGAAIESFILQSWLTTAFDEYVVRDGDLEAALAEAQISAVAYQECVANLPPQDTSTTGGIGNFQRIQQCITAANPAGGSLLPRGN